MFNITVDGSDQHGKFSGLSREHVEPDLTTGVSANVHGTHRGENGTSGGGH